MIQILSEQYDNGYKVKLKFQSNKDQECCEIYTLFSFMIKHDPAMFNAVLDELMPDVTESTYNMDPEKFAAYKMLLEDIE